MNSNKVEKNKINYEPKESNKCYNSIAINNHILDTNKIVHMGKRIEIN